MTDLQKHWMTFRKTAIANVNDGKSRKRNRDCRERRILQIVHESAFGPISAVQLYRLDRSPDNVTSYYCVSTTWNQSMDQSRFSNPVEQITAMRLEQLGMLDPAVVYTDRDIDSEVGAGIEDRLRAINLALPVPSNSIGVDGETWTVRVGDYMVGAEYHWWGVCPDYWTALNDVVKDVWAALFEPVGG